MANNRWIGKAQPRTARVAFFPTNVAPGSLWRLRVGAETYEFSYPASIVDGAVSDNDKSKVVAEGLVEQYSGGSFGGGAAGASGSLQSMLVGGKWAIVATGSTNGDPIDVEVTSSDADSSTVRAIELQAGVAASNEVQRIKWPKTPTGGVLIVRYKDVSASVVYNASASTLQTALEGLTSIGAGNVSVSGNYTDGYAVEFIGSLAGVNAELISAYSDDAVGVASVEYEITQRGGISRTTYTLSPLGGDSDALMRFSYEGEDSHFLSHASDADQILGALNSIDALYGNVDVNRESDGSFTIVLVAALVGGVPGTLTATAVSGGAAPVLSVVTGATVPAQTVQVISLSNISGDATGDVTLYYGGSNMSFPVNSSASTVLGLMNAASMGSDGWSGWQCTGGEAVRGKSPWWEFTANDSAVDHGLLVATTDAVGCITIETRTVSKPGKPRNSIQQIALHGDPDGGTFTLTYGANTTGAIAYNASAATVQSALQGLASIGGGNALVDGNDGGPWVVTFQGSLSGAPADLISGDSDNLTIASTSSVSEVVLQVATGPNWWTNPKNWSLDHVPTSTETVVFESGGVSCRYGITNVPAIAGFDHYRTFTGDIGLPETLDDGSPQTLPQYLTLSDKGTKITINIGLGQDGEGASVVRIDTQTQEADVNIQFAPLSTSDRSFSVGLAGKLATVNSGDAAVGIAVGTSLSATVDLLRVVPNEQSEQAVVAWGAGCVVAAAEVYRSRLQAASLPGKLTLISSESVIQGGGELSALYAQESLCRYQASGKLGKQGDIESLTTDVDGQVIIKSTAHRLATGNTVFIRYLFAFDDGYYPVSVIDSDHFTLLGSDTTWLAGNGVFSAVFGGGSVPGDPQWGLADAIRLGVGATIDFSEVGVSRSVVAPILLQAVDGRIVDPLHTVERLRWRCDPGFMTDDYGRQGVFQREMFRSDITF